MLHSHTQWDNAFSTSSERVCKRAADCVFVCAVAEHDVLGLNYSTQTHHSHWRNPNWGIQNKHTTMYTTPPSHSPKRPQLTAKGNVTGTAQQMGLSVFVSDVSACWSHCGLVAAGYASYVMLYLWSVTKIYLVVWL